MWKNGSSEARAPFMHNVVYGSYGYEVEKGEENLQNACPDYLASTLSFLGHFMGACKLG